MTGIDRQPYASGRRARSRKSPFRHLCDHPRSHLGALPRSNSNGRCLKVRQRLLQTCSRALSGRQPSQIPIERLCGNTHSNRGKDGESFQSHFPAGKNAQPAFRLDSPAMQTAVRACLSHYPAGECAPASLHGHSTAVESALHVMIGNSRAWENARLACIYHFRRSHPPWSGCAGHSPEV